MKQAGIWFLAVLMAFLLCSCSSSMPAEVPADFAFTLTWNTYGISSYDSETGLLVKTTDVFERSPEEYQTTLTLTEEQMAQVYALIRKLDPADFSDSFDISLFTDADPSMTLGISVRYGGYEKTVRCTDVAFYEDPYAVGKNKRFLECHKAIRDVLIATPEWQTLPDYEVFYE